jgi:hypothetical protein
MLIRYRLAVGAILAIVCACDKGSDSPEERPGRTGGNGGAESGAGGRSGNGGSGGQPPFIIDFDGGQCVPQTCAELGYACGEVLSCGLIVKCEDEGLSCGDNELCMGGLNGAPNACVAGGGACELCTSVPDCSDEPEATRLAGRVVTAGKNDADEANQIGVPNAIVYILRSNDPDDLPAFTSGIPADGTSCDRCEDQDLGPVLAGAITDATGSYEIEGNVPVGEEFVLVVKAGKFRRAVRHTLPASARCQRTTLASSLPDNPTRLPRSMDDGLEVNIPRTAITTGRIDAMECVFYKMGIAQSEFENPGSDGSAAQRIHLYRGGREADNQAGTYITEGAPENTPFDVALYGSLSRMQSYDMIVSDCEGTTWDNNFSQRDEHGANVREYVNRGGRMFASHLSFSWLHENGSDSYSASDPVATGLGPAASWDPVSNTSQTGQGRVSLGREDASPRIGNFADWMDHEGIATAPDHTFTITQPRSQNTALGANSEEFVYRSDGNQRVQQFSFNTPYGAPDAAVCGRVAYSGFHVSYGGADDSFANSVFPDECAGDLSNQEKVLLYMLFDLGACVGEPPLPPSCEPLTCEDACGYRADGCGKVLDCGVCPID